MTKIKFDKHNYRKHSDENKRVIRKSLEECGAGRSVVIDNEGELIAGNGVYEQAKALGIKTRIVETDGTELVVVKRTDLQTDDEKRKRLAMADNAASDNVEWNLPILQADFSADDLAGFGIKVPEIAIEQPQATTSNDGNLPAELQGRDIEPDKMQEYGGDDSLENRRVVIIYKAEDEAKVCGILGVESIQKVIYEVNELV